VETGSFEPYAARTVKIFNESLGSDGPSNGANQEPGRRSLSTTLGHHTTQQYDTIILKLKNIES
jgi:hypothetical protein